MPMFHTIEDILLMDKINLYQDKKKSLKVRKDDSSVVLINTLVHDPQKIDRLIMVGQFIQTLNITSYKIKKIGFSQCYVVKNTDAFNQCKQTFERGNYRDKK